MDNVWVNTNARVHSRSISFNIISNGMCPEYFHPLKRLSLANITIPCQLGMKKSLQKMTLLAASLTGELRAHLLCHSNCSSFKTLR